MAKNKEIIKTIRINNSLYFRIPRAFVKVFGLEPGEEYECEFVPGGSKGTNKGRMVIYKKVK